MRFRFTLAVAAFVAMATAGGIASAETLAACDQSIEYRIQPPDPQVPENMRAFSGVWIGKWDSGLCSALVVESITPDGTANLLYVNGAMGGQYSIKAGNRRFPGKLAGPKLTAAGQTVTVEYVLRSQSDLAGTYTSQYGNFRGNFARR